MTTTAGSANSLPVEFEHMVAHHRELTTRLREGVAALRAAVTAGSPFDDERAAIREFLAGEVIPHALAEEDTVYATSSTAPALAAVVTGMTMEHEALVDLAGQLGDAADGVSAASAATAFLTLFEVHVRKENELLLPALVAEGVDPAWLLAQMQSAFGRRREEAETAGDELVVDTRSPGVDSCVTVTNQAIDTLPVGKSFRLIADHDPIGLRYMLDAERPGAVTWHPLEDGPDRWQVRISKVAAAG